jgi:hypothetical protein
MANREPTLLDLARTLGISHLAAQRHAKTAGGAGALARKVQANLNHLLAGGSRRTMPGGLGGFMQAAVEAAAEGRAEARTTTRKPPTTRPSPSRLLQPPTKEEESEWSEEWLCPFSSNVYSYQFHQTTGAKTGTLFVTFRAAVLNTGNMDHGHVKRGKSKSDRQLVGTGGAVHAKGWARPFSEGSRYAYFDVPKKVYQQMRDAHSKGGAVWDLLRIRHTTFGHRYRYSLISGQVLPGKGGSYVARKATAKGFKTRSIAVVGQGKRGFITSTLAPSGNGTGFRTRSAPGR